MKAFVLVNSHLGHESEIKNIVLKLKRVTKVTKVFGAWDIVVYIDTPLDTDMRETAHNIREIEWVQSTLTLVGTDKE